MSYKRTLMKVDDISTWPVSSGRNWYTKHLKGQRLTQRQAILAQCCSCCCGYIDGRYSCEQPDCPLFPYMPYRRRERKDTQDEPL